MPPTVYDCRRDGRDPAGVPFPCNVRIVDPATGARIAGVFYARTSPPRLGRFVMGPAGEPLVDPKTRRKVRRPDGRGGTRVEVVYDRLEVWERRPWVAVAADTGRAVAQSEGCP